ncbi:LuxR C-terminal-related transcriptional regulator [Marinospirillum alkaliphilum]|uniref:Regulatory protein, luxR family n=1 Tax=Marinospirillum alkaliphilum DSM 21637 TaxID=1122209 RepID=A0A1K1Z7F0_9GAMM|nr:LuxR C-terminal-related transcriptional regulator [Marinospirillum alkaliphilum]SFX70030.1 regulatory protein, luxR family [Marinospirillum alkaliphilum DSM 21637]
MSSVTDAQGKDPASLALLPFRFEPPLMPAHTLVREHLLSLLEQQANKRLILLLAPAGGGKTLLLSQWMHSKRVPCCWFSLQPAPVRPEQLLTGLVLGLRQLPDAPERLGQALLDQIQLMPVQSAASFSAETLLSQLLPELTPWLPESCHLILDGVEQLDASSTPLLQLLIEGLPSGISLVLASRQPLPFSIHHHQLQEQVCCISHQQLAFSADEINQLFSQLNKRLQLPDINDLYQQTRGWPAAIRLVSQTGDFSLLDHWLQQEVLLHLPPEQQHLLAWLSVLPPVSADLLKELVTDAQPDQLENLHHSGLLLCLQDADQAPRYTLHPLLLKCRSLVQYLPHQSINSQFHQRAAHALERHGWFYAATQQAFLAGEPQLLAKLMEQLACWLLQGRSAHEYLQWKTLLGPEQLQQSPQLTLACCWAQLLNGQFEGLESLLNTLPDRLSTERNLLHCWQQALPGQTTDALNQTQNHLLALYPQLQQSLPEIRVQALHLITRLKLIKGQLKAARGFNREAMMLAHRARSPELEYLLVADHACIEISKGHLQLADHLLQQARRQPCQQPIPQGYLLLLQGYVYWLQGKCDLAATHLQQSLSLLQPANDLHLISCQLVLSLNARAQGLHEAAFDWINEAERTLHLQHPASSAWQPMITALKASLWLDQGKSELALTWLQQLVNQPQPQPLLQLPLQQQLLQLLHARALLAHRRYPQALEQLTTLQQQATEYPAAGLFILTHKAQALKHNRQTSEALSCLREALQLAMQEDFCMPFMGADASLQELLQQLREQLTTGSDLQAFAQRLLDQIHQRRSTPADPTRPVEALSSREEKVLLLVAEGLQNKEIAERLFISLHTVKTHLRHILHKLDVRSRTQAVSRARELRLL